MNGDTILTIVLIILLIYGFWCGWRRLTNLDGNNFLGGWLPQKVKDGLNKVFAWINMKKPVPVIVKIVLSIVLSYLFVAIEFLALFLRVFAHVAKL